MCTLRSLSAVDAQYFLKCPQSEALYLPLFHQHLNMLFLAHHVRGSCWMPLSLIFFKKRTNAPDNSELWSTFIFAEYFYVKIWGREMTLAFVQLCLQSTGSKNYWPGMELAESAGLWTHCRYARPRLLQCCFLLAAKRLKAHTPTFLSLCHCVSAPFNQTPWEQRGCLSLHPCSTTQSWSDICRMLILASVGWEAFVCGPVWNVWVSLKHQESWGSGV